jgi:hypothetical protein
MGWFGTDKPDGKVRIENGELDCEPQNNAVTPSNVKKVDDALRNGEKVHYFTKADHINVDGRTQSVTGTAYVVVTDTRVIGRKISGLGNTVATISLSYHNISSVHLRTGRLISKLEIGAKGEEYVFFAIETDDKTSERVVSFIQSEINAINNDQTESNTDPIDKLERLAELKSDGVISESEYNEKKSDLLDDV